jgi:hypothetical protein
MLEESAMAGRSLPERVEILEKKVESLEVLPAQLATLTGEVSEVGWP